MQLANRSRTAMVLVLSLAAHLAVLVWLGFVRGNLRGPFAEPPSIAVDIRPIVIPPRRPTATPASERPLVARQSRLPARESPVAPIVIPTAPPDAAPPPTAPDLGAMLRGRLDCSDLHRLSREERERCADRFAQDRPDELHPAPLGIDPKKQAAFDRQARINARKIAKREANPLIPGAKWDHEDAIGDVYVSGTGQEGILGGPKPEAPATSTAARRTPRLPP